MVLKDVAWITESAVWRGGKCCIVMWCDLWVSCPARIWILATSRCGLDVNYLLIFVFQVDGLLVVGVMELNILCSGDVEDSTFGPWLLLQRGSTKD